MGQQIIRDVQLKILEIMRFIDTVCRDHNIVYYIMGGTALGAIRHRGFIPWDDDLDIFMTYDNYQKFKTVIYTQIVNNKFVLQEWKIVDNYLEYSKVRLNGTTFIEEVYKYRKDMHHGIYVDIMILHKCPNNQFIQKVIYYASKYVTLVALSQRNWKPKTQLHKMALSILKILPNRFISNQCYKIIYNYDNLQSDYCFFYFITKANFIQGIFDRSLFEQPIDIPFEDTILMGPTEIIKYLEFRYGNYMKLPSKEQQKATLHAEIYDTEKNYSCYY